MDNILKGHKQTKRKNEAKYSLKSRLFTNNGTRWVQLSKLKLFK